MHLLFDIPDIASSVGGKNWGLLVAVGRLIEALLRFPCDVALVPGGIVDCCDPALGGALLGDSTWGEIRALPRSCDENPDLVCRVRFGHEPGGNQPQLPTCDFVYNSPFPIKYNQPVGRLCLFPLNGLVNTNYFPMNDKQHCRSLFGIPADSTVALKLISASPIADQNLVQLLDAVVELFRLGRAITLVVKSVAVPASRAGEFQAMLEAALVQGLLSKKWWTKFTNQNLFIFLEDTLPVEDMRSLYNASDFLIDTEGPLSSGVCVAEATACGIPSIIPATMVSHSQNPFVKRVPTLVPDGATGRHIVLSSQELAENILHVLDNEAFRCKAKALGNEHAVLNFDAHRTAGILVGVSRLARELYF
jgi:glycosyltransferase involved in cell wall biosynthesis